MLISPPLSVAKHITAFTNELNNRLTLRGKQRTKAEKSIERSSLFRSVAQNSCQIINCKNLDMPPQSVVFHKIKINSAILNHRLRIHYIIK